jgi:hypothetical protein
LAYSINPEFFLSWAIAEMRGYKANAARDGYGFSVRLNGTSDIDYTKVLVEGKTIFEIFPDVTFYDYTKNFFRFKNIPSNYQLTYSYSGRNWVSCELLLKQGYNVAAVFNRSQKEVLPNTYKGYSAVNGDLSDFRVNEGNRQIIGLYWKNIANKVNNEYVKNSIFAIQSNDVNIGN